MNKRLIMLFSYYSVGGTLLLDLVLTLYLFLFDPFNMPLNFLLILQMLVLAYNALTYFKLYLDTFPIVPFFLLKLAMLVLQYAFTRHIVWEPIILLVVADAIFLVAKLIKGFMFPYTREESTDEED